MIATSTILMANDICLRIGHTKHIRLVPLPKFFTFKGSNSHICCDMACQWIKSNIRTHFLKFLILSQIPIKFFSPCRQFFHIIGTGNKLTIFGIQPISSISRTSSRKNRSTVFIRNTYNL